MPVCATRTIATGDLVTVGVQTGCPELALLAAVVRVALEDSRRGSNEARRWLQGPECWLIIGLLTDDPITLDDTMYALEAASKSPKERNDR